MSFVSSGRLLSVCIYYRVRVLQGVIWLHIELYKPTDIELYWVSSPQHLIANKNVNITFFFNSPIHIIFLYSSCNVLPWTVISSIFIKHSWFLCTSSLSWPSKFNVRRSTITIETFYFTEPLSTIYVSLKLRFLLNWIIDAYV